MEEDMDLDGVDKEGEGEVVLVTDSKESIGVLLRRDMTMKDLDRDGVSKADDDDVTLVGNSTNVSVGPDEIASPLMSPKVAATTKRLFRLIKRLE